LGHISRKKTRVGVRTHQAHKGNYTAGATPEKILAREKKNCTIPLPLKWALGQIEKYARGSINNTKRRTHKTDKEIPGSGGGN